MMLGSASVISFEAQSLILLMMDSKRLENKFLNFSATCLIYEAYRNE